MGILDEAMEEARLEREWLKVGMEAKVGDAVKGYGLHVPSVCKFVNEKFRRPWPERLTDVVAYADDLHDALLESGAKFCDRVVREVLLDAVERVVVWKTWEIKHARRDILDRNCAILVSGVKGKRELRDVTNRAVELVVNRLVNGDLLMEDVSLDNIWKVFAEFSGQLENAYLLEPLRRMGILPEQTGGETEGIANEGKQKPAKR